MNTSSDRIYFLNLAERSQLFDDPLFAEFIISRCGPDLSNEDFEARKTLLRAASSGRTLSEAQRDRLDALLDWSERYSSCSDEAHRVAIVEVQG
jgi:hypothetical protein